ncbi:hypothetical protein QFC21_002501 [Naganishia friedmannii]|uniref:Uncharacterized protein n=1 Tax=Naganishia friedmannii TaxID=89922 RepID=A0ACC2VVQ4_9TREE|nr:hypothetical protein QFC21_002501 [Naganishia friedmannii]
MNQPSIFTTWKEAYQWRDLIEVAFPAGAAAKEAFRTPSLVKDLFELGRSEGQHEIILVGIRSTISAEYNDRTSLFNWKHFRSLEDWASRLFDPKANGGDIGIAIPEQDASAVDDATLSREPYFDRLRIAEANHNYAGGLSPSALGPPSGTISSHARTISSLAETVRKPNPSLGPTLGEVIAALSTSINADSASGTDNTSHVKPPTGSGRWSFRNILRRNKGEKPNDPSAHTGSTHGSKGTGAESA